MPTRKIQFYPGNLYHLFNRGNAKGNIFCNDRDRYRFLQAIYLSNNKNSVTSFSELERCVKGYTLEDIKEYFEKNKIGFDPFIKIYADCLMPNHYHFLVEEIKDGGIVSFMQRFGNSYAKYFTTKYDRPGSLFQGRFKAVEIETDDQLKYLIAYINVLNPAQLIESKIKENGIQDFNKVLNFVEKYNWSTHQEFIGRRDSIIVDRNGIVKEMFSTESYLEFVKNILHGKERNLWTSIDGLSLE
jgi:putative transposase